MTKRKRFAVSQALTRGLSETINLVENAEGIFRNAIIPLSRIELDPDNPRQILISIEDAKQGLRRSDPQYAQKLVEYENIQRLAHTIKERGLIQPIAVYKHDEQYRVVAGNRRCLASILANKSQIEARVFNHKPKPQELKIVQWIENTAREDLSLAEKVNNLKVICDSITSQSPTVKITANTLSELTGLSLTQAKAYLRILRADGDLFSAVKEGSIPSLDKAALIAQVEEPQLRQRLIAACRAGSELNALRKLIATAREEKQPLQHDARRGRTAKRINLGSTSNPAVVKLLMHAVFQLPTHRNIALGYEQINWKDFNVVSAAFRQLLNKLDKIEGNG